MKKILLFAFLLVGLFVDAQTYSIIKNNCQLEVYQGSKLSFNLNIRDIVWSSTAQNDFNLEDDNRKYGFDIRRCSNYPTRDSLYRTINRWKLSCYGGSDSAWSLIGNHNTDSTINYLGTDDNNPLIIKTNNQNRIKVMGGGSVGINTNAPTNTLDINGSLRVRGLSAGSMDSILGIDTNGVLYKMVAPSGGDSSYYLYSENYDAVSFTPQIATGLNSIAMGGGGAIASGDNSFSVGNQTVSSGVYSFSFGDRSTASGDYSIVLGRTSNTTDVGAISIGTSANANNEFSISIGNSTTANGLSSTSIGNTTIAESYVETAFGFSNTTYIPISDSTFELTDRLLVVGNGDTTQSDALTILKNAKVGIDIDNFETTISNAKLQVNGYINAVLNVYATHVLADADTNLKTNDFYKLTGDRTVYQKP